MDYTITKLDRRHSYHTWFAYMIEYSRERNLLAGWRTGVLDFDRSRRWFNKNFGWSQDVETRKDIFSALSKHSLKDFDQDTDVNPTWAYSCKYSDYRIYVQSHKELQWFVLAHPISNS
jgi:hypothetical protein